jgi:hypothetical protein
MAEITKYIEVSDNEEEDSCNLPSGGSQVFFSSPLHSVKARPTSKNRDQKVDMRPIVQLSCMTDRL